VGSGSLVLSGINTYSGGTLLEAGALVVSSAQALGTGNVAVNGGILEADSQPINVIGNYAQNAGGTLQLRVTGTAPSLYDSLHVTGNAFLNGTLTLADLGYHPRANDKLTLVTAGGVVSGRFSAFNDPFAQGPGYDLVELIYGRQSVVLQFLELPANLLPANLLPSQLLTFTTIDFDSFALTPNERASAFLLDSSELYPEGAALVAFFLNEPVAAIPADLEKFSPDA
jgi:autotransporter-associated beta strand protein